MYPDHEGNHKCNISLSWGQPNTRVHTALSRRRARQGPGEGDGTNATFTSPRTMKILCEERPRGPRRTRQRSVAPATAMPSVDSYLRVVWSSNTPATEAPEHTLCQIFHQLFWRYASPIPSGIIWKRYGTQGRKSSGQILPRGHLRKLVVWGRPWVRNGRGPGRCSNLVKKMVTQFFCRQITRKFVGETRLFEKFRSSGEEEARLGWRNVDRGPQKVGWRPCSLTQFC